ncbi:sulfonate ABC transporter substrate-binding protein [Fischerella thermalis CCMEE 5198]|jgi:NitT/TauT family transport system substrate-binding protein|uniref:ABC transporter substrate-binding protein n=1 Tax=Fischerella thermalis TaxID=372787 RepID=UPI000C806982|nr:ABC transporter substrate-binding protein [Fischerella thermalis]PMB05749.1 sulfonate ABC transporter substrate-binding protein [Fischerella thermalis CCMEE 5196]PMB23355.1 sulfonate ABC transporter substrate-binding protein [Fischerella thermalis CCMEE 5198]PMB53225.1 sulfonate ABC transporter substrate-binding protein [Fischerella thermalis CCMEE 5201]
MKPRSLLALFVIFLISLIVTVSCTRQTTTPTTNTATPVVTTPIKLGLNIWAGFFPWEVAKKEKLFEANKVNVDLKWFDAYLDSINALRAGQLDANGQTLNDVISSVAAGSDQIVVLTIDNSTGSDKVIVREGINSIADLKGKKVAAEEGTVDHFLILLGLAKAGLTQADIEFRPLETGAAAAAFVAGQVDAVGVFAPFTTKALSRPGSKELFSSKDFPGAISDHLVVSRKTLNERPQDVQALVNSWFATLDFIRANPQKSYEIMAERAGVSVSEYKNFSSGVTLLGLSENLKAFRPSQDMTSLQYAAGEISNFLIQTGLAKQAPDLSKLFDDRFVKAYAAQKKS